MPGPGPFEMVAAKLVEARVALEQAEDLRRVLEELGGRLGE